MNCGCNSDDTKVPQNGTRTLEVEFLYLDVNTCEPCGGTAQTLREALEIMKPPLAALGVDLVERKIHVKDQDIAIAHEFRSSPTIKIAGKDIDPAITEDDCPSCGSLAGGDVSVDCRTWHWNDEVYKSAPVGKIVEEIMAAVTGTGQVGDNAKIPAGDYTLPDNLKQFFAARNADPSAVC